MGEPAVIASGAVSGWAEISALPVVGSITVPFTTAVAGVEAESVASPSVWPSGLSPHEVSRARVTAKARQAEAWRECFIVQYVLFLVSATSIPVSCVQKKNE